MRMRRKKNLDNRIVAFNTLLLGYMLDYDISRHKNNITGLLNFKQIFGNENPIHLEIGCGKGGFITQLALEHPDINYIAMEKTQNVIITALEQSKNIPNLHYIIGNAEFLTRAFGISSIERIYLNFSCPYPKSTYANRRLTNPKFLKMYKEILVPNGGIFQKTDNETFFWYSVENYSNNGFTIIELTEDLHNSEIKGNIITEYEKRFISSGKKIFFVKVFTNQ